MLLDSFSVATVGAALRGRPPFETHLFVRRAATECRPYNCYINVVTVEAD